MKVWFAGVPGGGSPGSCKRERAKFFMGFTALVILFIR